MTLCWLIRRTRLSYKFYLFLGFRFESCPGHQPLRCSILTPHARPWQRTDVNALKVGCLHVFAPC